MVPVKNRGRTQKLGRFTRRHPARHCCSSCLSFFAVQDLSLSRDTLCSAVRTFLHSTEWNGHRSVTQLEYTAGFSKKLGGFF